jgi:hypothetical protein
VLNQRGGLVKDNVLGFLLALVILFLIAGAFTMPAILWIGIVAVLLLLGIFVRLGRIERRG